jgi:hypothetical protein
MLTDLRLVAVGDITENFLVPSYQRGYRWGADEVSALLDDIESISGDKDYCLQPVVVKKRDDGQYELVDGQQRLTTLYLLLLFMQKEGFKKSGPPFSLAYATRPQSAVFLQDLDPARAEENIDFFHLSGAFRCIQEWFKRRGNHAEVVANEMYVHLYRRVKVIWYEAEPEVDSTALFTRLNIGRIPLTNAELVKALLLVRSREGSAGSHRQIEIGMQWDVIERDLNDEGLWAFLTNRLPTDYPTRIELLFDLMSEKKTSDRFHTFHHFKKLLEQGRRVEDVWNDVLGRHDLVKEWYEDRDLYHSIGYLVATGTGEDDLRTLIRESATMTKTEVREGLKAKIVGRLNLTRDQIDELEYDGDHVKCSRVLLLFNVESTRRLKDSFDRYPFHADKKNSWSLEHVHAQNAEELVKKEQWQEWLREHAKALRRLRISEAGTAERDALVVAIDAGVTDATKESFARLAARVILMFSSLDAADDPHGIDNLALLPRELNSALNNAVFEVKRERILAMDRAGKYIPICTRRVFLKYYTESGDQQLQFWSKQDREAYLAAMFAEGTGVLTPSLKSVP